MATVYRIHPAIGIARVGNSPGEFFDGPERIGEFPTPSGGFKDGQCRVKRQAARFRIFAHHDDGSFTEIADDQAEITWTVHLVNSKATHPERFNSESDADLTIDPGPRSLTGINQSAHFDSGQIKFSGAPVTTVPLGEIRSTSQNHLLVLGGYGTSGSPAGTPLDSNFWASDDWYDDVSDGPVTAAITLRSDDSTPPVLGSWVIVAPPKFAPHQQSAITLYDRVLQAMVGGGLLPEPTTTSYTDDVYPILQRARDTGAVDWTNHEHTWTDPVTDPLKTEIFLRMKTPGGPGGGDMPLIYHDGSTYDDRLTGIQYAHLQRWKDADAADFTDDWIGTPPVEAAISPRGLDRAALEACVGASFNPGIEAGGLAGERPIIDASKYVEPFRLDHAAVNPGDITYVMALPWQNDFYQCADNWWPVPRPNFVTRQGMFETFLDGVVNNMQAMVDKWHQLGFIVLQGSEHVEVDRCDVVTINLLTPVLNFLHVPQGPMGMVHEVALAITFEVSSPSSAITLQYAPGGAPNHPQLVAHNMSVTVGPTTVNGIGTAQLWIIYLTSTVGSVLPPQTVTVQDAGGTQSWTITIIGDTVARKTAAAALVLDRSGSMADDRGDGQTKHASLQEAAGIFVDVMLEGDGVGLVRFDTDAQALQQVLPLGAGGLSDVNRNNTKDIINSNALDPAGATSIGDGIFEGLGVLGAIATPFDVAALVVLTDGVENRQRWISEVAADIDESTYAVGFGMPQNVSVAALQTVAGNNGGYLVVTGAIGTDNRFMLQKYFLQILAGISNAEVVLDPDGHLVPGRVERVPFQLTRADSGVDVILLTEHTEIVDFRIETPSGQIIEPWKAVSEPDMRFVLSDAVSYYRLALPIEFMPDRFDAGGTWHAVLAIGRPRLARGEGRPGSDLRAQIGRSVGRPHAGSYDEGRPNERTVPYSVVVHAYSSVSLAARIEQHSFEPGARVHLGASITQSGIPLGQHADVWADVTSPASTQMTVPLFEGRDGEFEGQFDTSRPGVYRCRIRVRGTTRTGEPFAREHTATATVWHGGDTPDPASGADALVDHLRDRDARLCGLLTCLFAGDGALTLELEERLRRAGLDLEHARACLAEFCHAGDRSNER